MDCDTAVSEELAMLRRTARSFLAREVVPYRDAWRRQGQVDRDVWRKAGKLGLLCISVPEEYGGGGSSFRHDAIMIEELERIGFSDFAVALHSLIVTPYIHHFGTDAQKRRWLPRLASGDMVAAIAMTEPGAGSDLKAIRTAARPHGDGFIINGQKTFISNGQLADLVIVVTKTDVDKGAKGISLFVVETAQTQGFRRGRKLEKIGRQAQDTSELFFDDMYVPKEALLGELYQGFFQCMQLLAQERVAIGIQAVSNLEAALEKTVAYVKERTAFGKKIFEFQNTRFVLAEVATEATIARTFLDHCIARLEDGNLDPVTAAKVKWWSTQKQFEIIDRCLQLHGGYGYMSEYEISHMWTDARIQKIYGGSNEIMKEIIAESL